MDRSGSEETTAPPSVKGDARTTRLAIVPSLLSADWTCLREQLAEVERAGADRVQIDVMDGHFVPPISLGPVSVEAVRRATRLPIEAHLMVERPEQHVESFLRAGAEWIIVHWEASLHLHRLVRTIREGGGRPGVALNPATPAALLEEILPELDLVLVMTVNPGYSGQAFLEGVLPKIRRVRQMIDRIHPSCALEVDGGIDATTAPRAAQAGADVFVAASAIFQHPQGIAAGLRLLRQSLATVL